VSIFTILARGTDNEASYVEHARQPDVARIFRLSGHFFTASLRLRACPQPSVPCRARRDIPLYQQFALYHCLPLSSLSSYGRRPEQRLLHLDRAAPAEVAVNSSAHLQSVGTGFLSSKASPRVSCRGAVPALEGIVLNEGLLDWVEPASSPSPSMVSIDFPCASTASMCRRELPCVDDYGAAAALAPVAAYLGPGESSSSLRNSARVMR